jgi:hypothetical protein
MPSAQELKRKKKKSLGDVKVDLKIPKSKTGSFRRPDDVEEVVVEVTTKSERKTEAIQAQTTDAHEEGNPSDITINLESGSERNKKEKKTKKLQLPNIFGLAMGTQLLKSKFPKSFGIAEKVVEDWLSNGDFKDIPIETPLVQFYVGEGLRRAKEVEKNIETHLDNAGVLPIVKHQLGRAQKWINKK